MIDRIDAFWVEFTDRAAACFEGRNAEDVKARASALGKVVSVRVLPYPAEPRIDPKTACPSFCHEPKKCAGHTSCRQRSACSE